MSNNWYSKFIKTAAKKTMYHGTSSKLIPSILKQGLMPDPPAKVYPEGEQYGSFYGSYMADNPVDAYINANAATGKFGGKPAIIEAQVETRSGLLDEDWLPDFLGRYTMTTIKMPTGEWIQESTPQRIRQLAYALTKSYIDDLTRTYVGMMRTRGQDIDRAKLETKITHISPDIFDIIHQSLYVATENNSDAPDNPYIIHEFRDKVDKLVRKLNFLTSDYGNESTTTGTIRMPHEIGFSGSNRIIAIMKINDNFEAEVVYGNPSPELSSVMDRRTERERKFHEQITEVKSPEQKEKQIDDLLGILNPYKS